MSLDSEYRFICKQQQELFEYAQKAGADVRAFAGVHRSSPEALSEKPCSVSSRGMAWLYLSAASDRNQAAKPRFMG